MVMIHVGDGPVVVQITAKRRDPDTDTLSVIDLSAATGLAIKVSAPGSRAVTEVEATFESDGTDGSLVAPFPVATFTNATAGIWRGWANFTLAGWSGSTHYVEFTVHKEGE